MSEKINIFLTETIWQIKSPVPILSLHPCILGSAIYFFHHAPRLVIPHPSCGMSFTHTFLEHLKDIFSALQESVLLFLKPTITKTKCKMVSREERSECVGKLTALGLFGYVPCRKKIGSLPQTCSRRVLFSTGEKKEQKTCNKSRHISHTGALFSVTCVNQTSAMRFVDFYFPSGSTDGTQLAVVNVLE